MEQVLEKLFESSAKVRIMRLLTRNLGENFSFPAILKRGQVGKEAARRELRKLMNIGLVRQKQIVLREAAPKKKKSIRAKKIQAYYANPEFRLLHELQNLIIKDAVASRKKLLARIKSLGNVKLAILSGVFVNSEKARTDLLMVGDNIKRLRLERFLTEIESELGRPLQYTVMDSDEFKYRMNMYDRFLRDILEFPHEKLINKLKI